MTYGSKIKLATFRVFVASFRALSAMGLRKHHRFDQAYWLCFQKLAPEGPQLLRLRNFSIYADSRDLFVSSLLTRDSVYEEFESNLMTTLLRPGMVFVDVGAQIGYYTLLAAGLCGEKGRVYAFEPNVDNYKMLLKSIQLNGFGNVVTFQEAVSAKGGMARLFLDSFNKGKHSLASLNVTAIDPSGGVQEVETTTLDDALGSLGVDSVDVVKIDAEGAEGLILEGATQTLRKPDITLFIEVWPFGQRNLGTDPVKTFRRLEESGFRCWRIDEGKRLLEEITDPSILRVNLPRVSFNFIFSRRAAMFGTPSPQS